jgi:hypothetical protein
VGEENDENPDDLLVALARFMDGAIDQHPKPKQGSEQKHEAKRQDGDRLELSYHRVPFGSVVQGREPAQRGNRIYNVRTPL